MLVAATLALAMALTTEPQVCPPPAPCPACPVCPPVAPSPPPKAWTGTVGVGVIAVTGNARSLTGNLGAVAEHKGERWIFGGKAFATYAESRAAGTSTAQTSAENAGVFLRGDYRLTPRSTAYVLAGVETDHPKSIEVRYSQEAGVSHAWMDWTGGEQKLLLRTDLGFRIAEEYRHQYFPVSGRVDPRAYYFKAPRGGVAFRWEMNKSVLFAQDVEALPNVDDGRVLVNSISKLSAKLMGPIALGVGYTVNYDSKPPAPKIPWDTTLAVTLDYLL